MSARNLVIILSDEHDPRCMGVSGHPLVQTPNLDAMALHGRRYTAATTPSPICVPARAAMATGLYPHQTGYWDNAMAYDGAVPSWGHALQRAGIPVESIGKLHYRSADLPTGFDRQHQPLHIAAGTGMVWGSVRDPLPRMDHAGKPRMIGKYVGPGETDYTRFDRSVTGQAVDWLTRAAQRTPTDKPWVLFIGLVAPHFPLVAPPDFAALYEHANIPRSKLRPEDGHVRHPWVQAMHDYWPHDDAFADEAERERAIAMYFALCSFMDHNLGLIRDALVQTRLADNTRLLYLSDHGDNLGARGLWGKSTLYQESVALPMILEGPDIEPGIVDTPVSLLDIYPTILDAVGVVPDDQVARPGLSLLGKLPPPDRPVLSEYHAVGAPSGAFMLRRGDWKYHHYVGFPPELYNLARDPEELNDLAADPAWCGVMQSLHAALLTICDPDDADTRARRDQARIIAALGGRDAAMEIGPFGATPAPGAR